MEGQWAAGVSPRVVDHVPLHCSIPLDARQVVHVLRSPFDREALCLAAARGERAAAFVDKVEAEIGSPPPQPMAPDPPYRA